MIEDGAAFYERLTGKIAIEALTPSSLIFSQDYRTPRLRTDPRGRILSVTVALVGLIGLAPVLAAIAVAIRLDSPGPVLFVQERVGRGGRRFQLMKFRTMFITDAPHSEWAADNTDRITRVGKTAAPVPARRDAAVRERAARRHGPGGAPAAPRVQLLAVRDRAAELSGVR